MNVTLTPELEELVKRKVESGSYNSSAEVVRAALHLLDEWEKLAALRQDIKGGLDQIDRGEYTEYNERTLGDLFAKVRERGIKRLQAEESKPASWGYSDEFPMMGRSRPELRPQLRSFPVGNYAIPLSPDRERR